MARFGGPRAWWSLLRSVVGGAAVGSRDDSRQGEDHRPGSTDATGDCQDASPSRNTVSMGGRPESDLWAVPLATVTAPPDGCP